MPADFVGRWWPFSLWHAADAWAATGTEGEKVPPCQIDPLPVECTARLRPGAMGQGGKGDPSEAR